MNDLLILPPEMRTASTMGAKALMVLGTGSDVGKSVIAAGLCRILRRRGVRVAPFKAQNMSLNSFVTPEGGEMGRAQALQASSCGLPPHVDMNPILLKPETDQRAQVVVLGKVWKRADVGQYFKYHSELLAVVRESYQRLAAAYDVIVIEGAGSAAEMNLRDRDLVNWPVAEMADAAVLLVADIDRGGVFAQVIGTADLLSVEERRRLIGVVVNRFRGDIHLFRKGVDFLEARTGLPVLGVIPHLQDLELDQEDSLETLRYRQVRFTRETVNLATVLLPGMSNFTDFNALEAEPDVTLRYAATPRDLDGADVVILPGSKTTIADFSYLQRKDFTWVLKEHVRRGGELIGICGGYQMLGKAISDPREVETGGHTEGLGLLDVATVLGPHKRTEQVEALPLQMESAGNVKVRGYEIHMGSTRRTSAQPCFRVLHDGGTNTSEEALPEAETEEGAMSDDGRVWGTYIHGVFDDPDFRRHWINRVRRSKGLPPLAIEISRSVTKRLLSALDRWADHLEDHLKLSPIFSSIQPYP